MLVCVCVFMEMGGCIYYRSIHDSFFVELLLSLSPIEFKEVHKHNLLPHVVEWPARANSG